MRIQMRNGYDEVREVIRRFDAYQRAIAVAPDEHDRAAARAARVVHLCSRAGAPHLAADFLKLGASPRQVRAALAEADDDEEVLDIIREQQFEQAIQSIDADKMWNKARRAARNRGPIFPGAR